MAGVFKDFVCEFDTVISPNFGFFDSFTKANDAVRDYEIKTITSFCALKSTRHFGVFGKLCMHLCM